MGKIPEQVSTVQRSGRYERHNVLGYSPFLSSKEAKKKKEENREWDN